MTDTNYYLSVLALTIKKKDKMTKRQKIHKNLGLFWEKMVNIGKKTPWNSDMLYQKRKK